MSDARDDWVENLKIGDSVIVTGFPDSNGVERVVRITRTLIFLESGRRFNMRGRHYGTSTWSSRAIQKLENDSSEATD